MELSATDAEDEEEGKAEEEEEQDLADIKLEVPPKLPTESELLKNA